jgi:hypothetical protein
MARARVARGPGAPSSPSTGDRGFESGSLQRRVSGELGPRFNVLVVGLVRSETNHIPVLADARRFGPPAADGSLRKRAPHPEVELHPEAARARGVANGDWASIETPDGSVRARARFNERLDPQVVVGEHGWWSGAGVWRRPSREHRGPRCALATAPATPPTTRPMPSIRLKLPRRLPRWRQNRHRNRRSAAAYAGQRIHNASRRTVKSP